MKTQRDKHGKVLKVGDAIHVVSGVNRGRHAVVDGFASVMVRLTWTSPREWEGKRGRVTPGKCVIEVPQPRRYRDSDPDWIAFLEVMEDNRIVARFAELVDAAPAVRTEECMRLALAALQEERYAEDESTSS